ncbi:MAG: phosphomannomutase/phosphoglucomutase [Acidimicrobiales bacterium]
MTSNGAPIDPARLDAVVKAYDIRGTYPDQLDAAMVEGLGAAFAAFALATDGDVAEILIGRDMRPSGVELADAFARGVTSQGVDVVHLGLCSTDEVFFASGHWGAPAAQLTASHNPAQYNGIKLCLSGAKPVGEDSGLGEIKAAAAAGVAPTDRVGAVGERDALAPFADHVRSFVDADGLAPLRVVADTANGMGGLIAPAVFAGLPIELEVLFGELDGTFPNHPADPIQPENLRDLQARVLETGADVGLAFDGDADRVFLVDDEGQLVSGSLTTAIVAREMLELHPGSTILHNLICSKAVPEVIVENGGTPVRTRVGHSLIKKVMADTGAAFGGEHSGHYYFRDNYRADSGIIAALVVLQALSHAGVALSVLRKPFERYAASGELNTTVPDTAAVIDRVAAAYPEAEQDRLDGLTVDLGEWWFNLRPSNTEPLLRLNLEAPDDEAVARRVAEVQAIIAAEG